MAREYRVPLRLDAASVWLLLRECDARQISISELVRERLIADLNAEFEGDEIPEASTLDRDSDFQERVLALRMER